MTPPLSLGALAALQAAGDCGVRLQGEGGEVLGVPSPPQPARELLAAHRFEIGRFLAAQGATLGSAKLWSAADTMALVAETVDGALIKVIK